MRNHIKSIEPELSLKVEELKSKLDIQIQSVVGKIKTEFLFK